MFMLEFLLFDESMPFPLTPGTFLPEQYAWRTLSAVGGLAATLQ